MAPEGSDKEAIIRPATPEEIVANDERQRKAAQPSQTERQEAKRRTKRAPSPPLERLGQPADDKHQSLNDARYARFMALGVYLSLGALGLVVFLFDHVQFNRMKPDEHLRTAKIALTLSNLDDAERNLNVIPRSPETDEVWKQLKAAREAESQAATERAERADSRRQLQRAEVEQRGLYIGRLQKDLTETGYDVTVSWSGNPAMVTIASNDFENTERRVSFLAYLRKQSADERLGWPCFSRVRLTSGGWFGPFTYSSVFDLACR
jgi:hypothetical protein